MVNKPSACEGSGASPISSWVSVIQSHYQEPEYMSVDHFFIGVWVDNNLNPIFS